VSDSANTAEWDDLQRLLFSDRVADILMLLDCCHSGSTITARLTDEDRLVETIVACSSKETTPVRGKYSFTQKLITVLGNEDYWKLKQFETIWLYSGLLSLQNDQAVLSGWTDKPEKNITPLYTRLLSPRENARRMLIHRLTKDGTQEVKDDIGTEDAGIEAPKATDWGVIPPEFSTENTSVATLVVLADRDIAEGDSSSHSIGLPSSGEHFSQPTRPLIQTFRLAWVQPRPRGKMKDQPSVFVRRCHLFILIVATVTWPRFGLKSTIRACTAGCWLEDEKDTKAIVTRSQSYRQVSTRIRCMNWRKCISR
jgi:hypothetical protein